MQAIRKITSGKLKWYKDDNTGIELCLSYITPRIIGMSFPATGLEQLWRHSYKNVKSFLDFNHPNRYKVYNLCEERVYPNTYWEKTERYGFFDHSTPNIEQMFAFCQDASEWLASNAENVVVIHCKAGKGRTGLFTCALLLHLKISRGYEETMYIYARERTTDGKGITIKNQIRYVDYFDTLVNEMSGIYENISVNIGSIHLYSRNERVGAVYKINLTDSKNKILLSSTDYESLYKVCSHCKESYCTFLFPLTFSVKGDFKLEFQVLTKFLTFDYPQVSLNTTFLNNSFENETLRISECPYCNRTNPDLAPCFKGVKIPGLSFQNYSTVMFLDNVLDCKSFILSPFMFSISYYAKNDR